MNQVIDKADELTKQRRELRLKILQEAILNSSATELQADFDGYGDSGSLSGVYSTTHDVPSQIQEELDDLFDTVLGKYVTFDWYNNDGGGGNITWKVQEDKIIINAHYNENIQHDEMIDEEF